MANLDGEEVGRRARRKRHPRSPSPAGILDWKVERETYHHSLPYRTLRGKIQRSDTRTSASELRRSRKSPTSPPRSRSKRHSTMPLLARTPTVSYRRGRFPDVHSEESLRSDSWPSSQRDRSPRSGRYYQSTPLSKRSSRTSMTQSEHESDLTVSTQDERDRKERLSVKEEERSPSPAERRRRRRRRRESPIYEEDGEEESRTGHYVDEWKSPSRRSPGRHDSGSSVRREYREHPHRREVVSMVESRPPFSSKRASRRAYQSEIVHIDPRSSTRRPSTTGVSQVASTVSSSTKRHSFLGGFFGPSNQTVAPDKPIKYVECVVCLSELPSAKMAKLKCGHRMCNSCLKRSFKLSITDPQLMPPKCCTTDHIPLKHVDRLFDNAFKKSWNKKFVEFSTRNRIYCPSKRCGEWIKPENIHREDGRKVGKCSSCKTRVCCLCNGKWHSSRQCPRDEETNKILEQAKEEGWQRCFKCRAMVELKEGCNHMTCRCGAQFCMICGTKWKGCDCPWFNYDAIEADRLLHMQIPMHDEGPPSPREFRGGPASGHAAARPRPETYEEEMLLRQVQEERDEQLARRLQVYEPNEDYQGDTGDVRGIGSHGHFMSEEYRRGPSNFIVPPSPPIPAPLAPPLEPLAPFQRPSPGGDYVAGVNRERGVRASSMERRLAERFSEHRHSQPHSQPQRQANMPVPPTATPVRPLSGMPPPPPADRPMLRRHTIEAEVYNNARSTRPSERVVAGRRRHDYATEAAVHSPSARRQHRRDEPKMSTLAGLTGPGRGMNRVFEWRNHVEPGVPEGEATPTPT